MILRCQKMPKFGQKLPKLSQKRLFLPDFSCFSDENIKKTWKTLIFSTEIEFWDQNTPFKHIFRFLNPAKTSVLQRWPHTILRQFCMLFEGFFFMPYDKFYAHYFNEVFNLYVKNMAWFLSNF